jgi:hypothetical protein
LTRRVFLLVFRFSVVRCILRIRLNTSIFSQRRKTQPMQRSYALKQQKKFLPTLKIPILSARKTPAVGLCI